MKTIYLYPKDADVHRILELFDINLVERQIAWLYALPETKRGNPPFQFSNQCRVVRFARREDATAFRLIFGL